MVPISINLGKTIKNQINYLTGPYFASPNYSPAHFSPALTSPLAKNGISPLWAFYFVKISKKYV